MLFKRKARAIYRKIFLIILFIDILLSAGSCTSQKLKKGPELKPGPEIGQIDADEQEPTHGQEPTDDQQLMDEQQEPPLQLALPVDYNALKVNESGQVIIVMFHKFVEKFTPTAADRGDYTTTFTEFEKLLDTLYSKGYRLISLNDFLDNRIDVPAGYTPIIFTFDDGSFGQFHLEEKDGRLLAAERSAVGIMERFNSKHPDFGLKGVFYLNLGLDTFGYKGSLRDKILYLTSRGYDIGSHTYSHVNLGAAGPDTIQKEMSKNVKLLMDITGGYKADTLALPYGIVSEKYSRLLEKGKYEEIQYENRAILLVGASPSNTPSSPEFSPSKIPRVRATGIISTEGDLKWWLKIIEQNPKTKYVSDGNPHTIAVPKDQASKVDIRRLKSNKLIIY